MDLDAHFHTDDTLRFLFQIYDVSGECVIMGQPSTFRPRDIKQGTTSCPMCGGTNTRIHVGAHAMKIAKKEAEEKGEPNTSNIDERMEALKRKGEVMRGFAGMPLGKYEEAGEGDFTLGFGTKKGCKYCGHEGET